MKDEEYLITGDPFPALLKLAFPMILGSVFQQIYNMVDSIVVGQVVGQNALAAVGACAALTTVFICIAGGAGVGASVLVSRYFGARDYGRMKSVVSASMLFFLFLSILLGVAGILVGRPIMVFLNTPPETLPMAVAYLRIYFAGFPFLFLYNICSSMFNAIGKSAVPLWLLLFSSLLNIVLDIWMVAGLEMGVSGAAFATVIAQGISAGLSLWLFYRQMRRYHAAYRRFDRKVLIDVLRLAVPSIIQQSTVSIGMMFVQSVVNRFGAEALAGYSATMRVENIFSSVFMSIGNAVSPYVAQNLGAGKSQRVRQGYRAALLLDALVAAIAFVWIYGWGRQIAGLFLGESGTALAYSVSVGYMRWIGASFFVMGIKMATDGVLRGYGDMNVFMAANLVNLGIRITVAFLLAPRYGVGFVWYAVPLGWLANFLISYQKIYRRRRPDGIVI